jgi:hypothetical protein
MCRNLTTLPSCLMLSKHINQLREERSYQTWTSNLHRSNNFSKSMNHKEST